MGEKTSTLEKAVTGAIALATVVSGVKAAKDQVGKGATRPTSAPDRSRPGRDGDRSSPAAGSTEEAKGPKKLVMKVDRFQRSHAWLGFPLAVVKKFGEDQAGNLAALISYYTFFSIFPLMLALVTVLGFVLGNNPEMQEKIVDSALAQFPVIGDQIRENVGSLSGNWIALIIGVAGALWAGMGAVDATQNAMNTIWDVPIKDKPKFLVRRLKSFLMLVVVGGGLFLTAASSTVAASVESIGPPGRLAAPVLALVINVGIFLVAFRVLTQKDVSWSDVLPGAVVAGIAAVLFQLLGGLYVDRTLRGATQTYGTFAVVIGLLSWLYLQAQIVIFAAEINVVRARRLSPRSLTGDDLTEPDRRALAAHAEVEERIPEQDVRTALPGEQGERGVDRQTVDIRD